MEIINKIIGQISKHRYSSSSGILAHSLYSACHHGNFPGPNLLNVSSTLDQENKKLFFDLANISTHNDFSNDAQSEGLKYIRDNWGECIEKWEKGHRCQ